MDLSPQARIEWPTWLLIAAIYAGFAAVTYFHAAIPLWLLPLVGGWFVAWHSSLEHEAVHGHPTRSARLNRLIAGWPLSLYLPFEVYFEQHMSHHGLAELTHPQLDTESYYVTEEEWAKKGRVTRAILTANQTLLGRLLLGPFLVVLAFVRAEAPRVFVDRKRMWTLHGIQVAILAAWLAFVCHMPLWKYVLCFVYPGIAITLMRSFYEHRPWPAYDGRTVIIEAHPLLALLYLNNNLHYVHHDRPAVAWYRLPGIYRDNRDAIRTQTAGHLFDGYGAIARKYLLTVKDSPIYPPALMPTAEVVSLGTTVSVPPPPVEPTRVSA
jgi:fatty acid desaturase